MPDQPLVSVIIPVYNAERYLEECLISVFNQTHSHVEIIAVNDGSTDRSGEILKHYSNKIQIVSKPQGGTASARNAGISIATGEWIKLLDNDDILFPSAISILVKQGEKLEKNGKVLYGNVDYINSSGRKIGFLNEPDYNSMSNFERNVVLIDHSYAIPSTWMVHKSVFDRCGLFDVNTEHDDYEFHLRACLLHNCEYYLVKEKIAKYRIHDKQFTWQVMRKYDVQDIIASKVINQLGAEERSKYMSATAEFRSNRNLFERASHFGKPILKFMPIKIEMWLRSLYLKILEKRNIE